MSSESNLGIERHVRDGLVTESLINASTGEVLIDEYMEPQHLQMGDEGYKAWKKEQVWKVGLEFLRYIQSNYPELKACSRERLGTLNAHPEGKLPIFIYEVISNKEIIPQTLVKVQSDPGIMPTSEIIIRDDRLKQDESLERLASKLAGEYHFIVEREPWKIPSSKTVESYVVSLIEKYSKEFCIEVNLNNISLEDRYKLAAKVNANGGPASYIEAAEIAAGRRFLLLRGERLPLPWDIDERIMRETNRILGWAALKEIRAKQPELKAASIGSQSWLGHIVNNIYSWISYKPALLVRIVSVYVNNGGVEHHLYYRPEVEDVVKSVVGVRSYNLHCKDTISHFDFH